MSKHINLNCFSGDQPASLKLEDDHLGIFGGPLCKIAPQSVEDCDRFIAWLEAWRRENGGGAFTQEDEDPNVNFSDGGYLEPPEEGSGRIRRRDNDGCSLDWKDPGDEDYDDWLDLFGLVDQGEIDENAPKG